MIGGVPVLIDTIDFRMDPDKVVGDYSGAKVIIFNSPANPTGHVATREEVEGRWRPNTVFS